MEFDTTAPIWVQLVTEFSRRIVTGQWAPGEKMPGVRELAGQLGVNPNTVQRALREMEYEQLCRSERTSGRFVTHDLERIQRLRRSLVVAAADEFIATCVGLHMAASDAVALINERWRHHELSDFSQLGPQQ